MALGVIMLAYSAHACLPSVYNSMEHPKQFPLVVVAAFACMFLMYGVMGGFGCEPSVHTALESQGWSVLVLPCCRLWPL